MSDRGIDVKQRLLAKLQDSNFGVETVEVLETRNSYGHQVTESLVKYISMRVEIEKDYAKALGKLSEYAFPDMPAIIQRAMKTREGYKVEPGNDYDSSYLGSALSAIQSDLGRCARNHRTFAVCLENEVLVKFQRSLNGQTKTQMRHKSRLLDSAENIIKTTKVLAKLKRESMDLACRVKACESKTEVSQTAAGELGRVKNVLMQAQQKEDATRCSLASMRKTFMHMISEASEDVIDAEQERITTTVSTMKVYARILESQAEAMRDLTRLMTIDRSNMGLFIHDPGRLDRVNGPCELMDFCWRYVYPTLTPLEESYKQISLVEYEKEDYSDVSSDYDEVDLLYEAGF